MRFVAAATLPTPGHSHQFARGCKASENGAYLVKLHFKLKDFSQTSTLIFLQEALYEKLYTHISRAEKTLVQGFV